MFQEELHETPGQLPGLGALVDGEVEGDGQLGLDPALVVLGQREAGGVDLLGLLVEAVHQLPVGPDHHLGAGQVQGVAPVPVNKLN